MLSRFIALSHTNQRKALWPQKKLIPMIVRSKPARSVRFRVFLVAERYYGPLFLQNILTGGIAPRAIRPNLAVN